MGKMLKVKVCEKGSRADNNYKNEVNLVDHNQLVLVFEDLESMFNAPIKKACRQFLDKGKIFPLSP